VPQEKHVWSRFNAKFDASTTCGGDLEGALAGPQVAGIRGVSVASAAPLAAQVLRFDGTEWAPASLGIADVGGLSSGYVDQQGNQTLGGTKTFTSAPVFGAPLAVASGGTGATSAGANEVFAGPASGIGAPGFRALVAGDVPAHDASRISTGTLAVDRGGTGASSPFAEGSLVFAGATGSYSHNALLRWDDGTGRLGIGTSAPAQAFDVRGDAGVTGTLRVDGAVRAQQLCDVSGANCRDLTSGWKDHPTIAPLEDAPTIQVDASLGTIFEVTLGDDRTLANPTGAVKGESYTFWIRQDSAGGRKLAWGSQYLFSANSIPATAPNAVSAATFVFDGANLLNTGGYNLSGIVPFNFNNATGVGVSAVIVSNAITLSGISGAVLASITGPGSPTLSVNNGAWVTTASVAAGDTLKVRAASSANVVTTTSELIVVGGYTTSWSITTTTNPSAFSFTNVLGSAWNTVVESGAATPTGYTGALPVSVTGEGSPEISIDGGAWVATGTTAGIAPGQTLALRLTSAGAAATTRSCTLTMGSFSTSWSVATTPSPGSFSFANQTGIAWNTTTTAPALTPTGHTGPLVTSVAGEGSPQISVDGGAWGDSGIITPGQTLAVRLTSANAPNATRAATVTVGSYQTTWSVTTTPNPNAFSFTDISTGVAWNTLTTAAPVTPAGFNGPLVVKVSGQGSPQVSIAGGTWSNQDGVITPGQTLAVRLTSAGASATAYSATVTVGSYQTTWTVTTTPNPTAFGFTNASGVSWNALTTPTAQTPAGYNGPLQVKVEGSAGSPEISVAGGTWTAAGTWLTINTGQTLGVRMTSAGASNSTRSATITMGSYTTTWTVTTTADPSFTFANQTGVAINTVITSATATPTGLTGTVPISVSGQGSPEIAVNGSWMTSGTLSQSQTLAVRLTSAGTASALRQATIVAGGFTFVWSVTTTSCIPGSQTFSSSSSFTVPTGCSSLTVRLWGAGGGAGGTGSSGVTSGYGGGGGFVQATFAATAGESLSVEVGTGGGGGGNVGGGSGGSSGGGSGGGGDSSGANGGGGGGGGGPSRILRSSTVLLVAAGGGGGGGSGYYSSSTAVPGEAATAGGSGNASGGSVTCSSGRCAAGGSGSNGGGGGGGGGSGSNYNTESSSVGGRGGKGGTSAVNSGSGTTTAGSGTTPGGTGDPGYVSGVGVGAPSYTGTSTASGGNAGRVVVAWP